MNNASKITILLAVFILSLVTINPVEAQYTTTSINVTEFSFTPSTIDSTNGEQTVTITIHITDTERDFWRTDLVLRSPRTSYGFDFAAQDRISGNARDGVYRKTFTFWQYAEAGTWVVSRIFVYDGIPTNYRWREFYTPDLVARGFATQLQVINNNETVPPEISEFNFTPTTTSGFRDVTVTLRAKDETSGVSYLEVDFTNPPGCYYYDDDCGTIYFGLTAADRISGDDKDGVYRHVINISDGGTTIYGASVYAEDAVRNSRSLSSADLAARGFPSQLQITEVNYVGISGKVSTPDGRGLRNASVTLTDSQGDTRTVTTSSFGFYSFDNVGTGSSYTIAVSSRRYRYASRSLQIDSSLTDMDFVGLE